MHLNVFSQSDVIIIDNEGSLFIYALTYDVYPYALVNLLLAAAWERRRRSNICGKDIMLVKSQVLRVNVISYIT